MSRDQAEEHIQDLSVAIYSPPLSNVRREPAYPDLHNPLHVVILILDADTEITMQGMLGFLENSTGKHLGATVAALELVGAARSAAQLAKIQTCMASHGVTWKRLRGDFEGMAEYEITSFSQSHPDLRAFTEEVSVLGRGFQVFDERDDPEGAYQRLCDYLGPRLQQLEAELAKAGR